MMVFSTKTNPNIYTYIYTYIHISNISNRNLNPSIAVFQASAEPNFETIKVVI